jgi:multidrug efflux pump subunit AcrA (membrane-fusion protein)
MSVTASVPTGRLDEYLTVPNDAILRSASGPYVYVVRAGGANEPARAIPTDVAVLFQHGGRSAIREGPLRPGDQVVTEGNERLFPAAPVLPAQAPAVVPGGAG